MTLDSREVPHPVEVDLASPLFEQAAVYLKPRELSLLEEAYQYSRKAHQGQFRKTGEPYVSHPVAVSQILTSWNLDAPALIAALLHDVVEDTHITKSEIGQKYGEVVADLVDGVSKLDKISFESQKHEQAENFRKMLLAMAKDVRVMLIKLADRLHNMRTLTAMQPQKRRRIAKETLEIYAPIANRLGLNDVYRELQELSLSHLYPNRYKVLSKAVKRARGNRKELIKKVLGSLQDCLRDHKFEATVSGREKAIHSIYRKMTTKTLSFAEVFDIYGFRVVVKDIPSCYVALGILHQRYKPVPGKFKDYIAIPKANGYQSLHSTLLSPVGTPIEVQIRTTNMDQIAESGVASHWLYKETDDTSLSELQTRTHQWMQNLLQLQSEPGNAAEFLEHLKLDLFPDEVFVFTPKGKIISLPRGATTIDFAYAVHTDVGNSTLAAKVNHEPAPLNTELRSGDRVEIITSKQATANPHWLRFIVTSKARSQIRHSVKSQQHEESALLGARLLKQALNDLKMEPDTIAREHWDRLAKEYTGKTKNEILSEIGLGKQLAIVVARHLLALDDNAETQTNAQKTSLVIHGTEGMALQFAKCCHPIPGDPIIGYLKKGHGLNIHTHDCPISRRAHNDPHKWIDVEWDPDSSKSFLVKICVLAQNGKGLLGKIATKVSAANANIETGNFEQNDSANYAEINLSILVTNRIHLARVIRNVRSLDEVTRITRLKS
ncbi:MAG: bifunctional (p)ppGpp synthetase/guanosine-3',5'-bis(diphosphate) 3'-pyrophosphohydrolase [Burkholderiales bacterium]|nr:bifunctional (p)ppGpp synthetase/guanosine-3',5'-bis(diphosphate) 3'-pyrophosphohydrolase [Burkholderiales bacterium]